MATDEPPFEKNDLFRRLDAAGLPKSKAARAESRNARSIEALIVATAELSRATARERFGRGCLVLGCFVAIVAIYMRMDGDRLDSMIMLILAALTLLGGAWHIHRAYRETLRRAADIERLREARSGEADS